MTQTTNINPSELHENDSCKSCLKLFAFDTPLMFRFNKFVTHNDRLLSGVS